MGIRFLAEWIRFSGLIFKVQNVFHRGKFGFMVGQFLQGL